ncbi:hypothetical protein P280DRAFT_407964 [Massarina eburnea CBS 473.64]|uniref:GIY-YIG domain-containing protein n=1 Tax=Massarina eburnea CBS 473.64 TaxID=1395130 RepID=A0A6A6RNT9_9PLEO|nr:hypothetical protein P280DRAFT_407964 [Massarina eburnea CBS 473.64]
MEEFPGELTRSQLEALEVLQHILSKLKDPSAKWYARYGKWVERHKNLDEFCFRCTRSSVWKFLDGKWNLDQMKLIGGNTKQDARGIYFNGIHGLDKKTRLYIGQSQNIRYRISQHWNFRYRRDNPSLHYYALQRSDFNLFGILATIPSPSMGYHALPGMDSPDLLLNLLEMWMAIMFKCLPKQTMQEWVPEGVKVEGVFGALNIATPLDTRQTGRREWVDLGECEDPLVREYIDGGERKRSDVEYRDRKTDEAVDQTVGNANRNRNKASRSKTLGYEGSGDSLVGVMVVCGIAAALGYTLWRSAKRT